jgi:plasmid stability protein
MNKEWPGGTGEAKLARGCRGREAVKDTLPSLPFCCHVDIDPQASRRYNVIATQGGHTMTVETKRATVYLDTELHKALKLKAVETSRSVSELVNDAVREALAEDAEDLEAFEERAAEPLISYDEMVKRLKRDGRI